MLESIEKYPLPNGQAIYQLNPYETDFVFNEIFIDETYIKHGITIPDNAIVFDIGANIGLFSLYIKEKWPTSQVYAFEPVPEIYRMLSLNTAIFAQSVQAYNYGLSAQEQETIFHYYPGYSVISGFHANQKRDAEIIISGMQSTGTSIEPAIKNLVHQRLSQINTFSCLVTTISHMIQRTGVSSIDLLKIDVEGAELAVLSGIAEHDWDKIQQITMEVHNKVILTEIMALLKDKFFSIHVEEDKRLKSASIYNLFAIGIKRCL